MITQKKKRVGPLQGITVMDFSRAVSGPYATQILADLGANVIKVEGERGGRFKLWDMPIQFQGDPPADLALARSKKSIGINLGEPKGKEVFYDLVKKADIVFDNFRPGVTQRLQIDYETLKEIKPDIICCSISGFGQTGPWKDRTCYDLIGQAMSGGMSYTGEQGRPPVRAGIPISDISAGFAACCSMLAAVVQKQRTGQGQMIDIAMMDVGISMLIHNLVSYFLTGKVHGPMGSGYDGYPGNETPSIGAYKTKDDKYICIMVLGTRLWQSFCRALGHEEWLEDERLNTYEAICKYRNEAKPLIEKALATKTLDEWLDILHKADVPGSPILDLQGVSTHPQTLARNMVVEIEHVRGGSFKAAGNPIKTTAIPEQVYEPLPIYGQHTKEILTEMLGYSEEKIEELSKEEVIFCSPEL